MHIWCIHRNDILSIDFGEKRWLILHRNISFFLHHLSTIRTNGSSALMKPINSWLIVTNFYSLMKLVKLYNLYGHILAHVDIDSIYLGNVNIHWVNQRMLALPERLRQCWHTRFTQNDSNIHAFLKCQQSWAAIMNVILFNKYIQLFSLEVKIKRHINDNYLFIV